MKTAIMLLLLAIMAMSGSAYEVNKWVSVTGDWKWDDCQWKQGNYETAQYAHHSKSAPALNTFYAEPEEKLGSPWKYELEAHVGYDAPGFSDNMLNAWTVNDPETTPATGGHTKYKLAVDSFGKFSAAHLEVKGQGWTMVNTHTKFTSDENQQDILVDIN